MLSKLPVFPPPTYNLLPLWVMVTSSFLTSSGLGLYYLPGFTGPVAAASLMASGLFAKASVNYSFIKLSSVTQDLPAFQMGISFPGEQNSSPNRNNLYRQVVKEPVLVAHNLLFPSGPSWSMLAL